MSDVGLEPIQIGRYALYQELAAGGMATIHYGRLLGSGGFARTVAIKRLHPHFAKDPDFVSMFLDEARLAARIRHPNVVPTLDVVATSGELFLVMEYVHGQALARLMAWMRRERQRIPLGIVASIMAGALHGLHAANEARDERGEPLGIVHRDVSPQNVLVGVDGVARMLDFGVAKAAVRLQTTREGRVKGKLAYMSPEQLDGSATRRSDVYAAAVVLWEALAGERLFSGDTEGELVGRIQSGGVEPPSRHVSGDLPPAGPQEVVDALDAITLRGLERDPTKRFATAREMAIAIERCVTVAPAFEVGNWVETVAADVLSERSTAITRIESDGAGDGMAPGGALVAELTRGTGEHTKAMPLLPEGTKTPEGTQLSSISVSIATRSLDSSGGPSKRRRNVIIAACTTGLVLTGALLFATGHRTGRSAPSPSSVAASDPPPPAAPALPPVVAETTPTQAPLPPPSATLRSDPPTAAPRPPSVRRPSPVAPNCTPPYSVDSAGRRHYRAECL